ncbi:hypothetical protein OAB15_01375 [Porticoccaceae bacterium]|jgi:hypothetical protein|nr:hypothetical protein [Porticoccaceae bacterium]
MINTLDSQPRGDIAATDVMRESDIEAVARTLTWAFLGNRLLHTFIHVGSNYVPKCTGKMTTAGPR